MKLLLDTNVLLDYCFPSRPLHKDVFEFINQACNNGSDLYASITSTNTFFYIAALEIKNATNNVNASIRNEMTYAFYDNISSLVTFVGCDESDLFIASKKRYENTDFEDNLIIASAIRLDADYIITSDKELLKKQIFPTKSPQEIFK